MAITKWRIACAGVVQADCFLQPVNVDDRIRRQRWQGLLLVHRSQSDEAGTGMRLDGGPPVHRHGLKEQPPRAIDGGAARRGRVLTKSTNYRNALDASTLFDTAHSYCLVDIGHGWDQTQGISRSPVSMSIPVSYSKPGACRPWHSYWLAPHAASPRRASAAQWNHSARHNGVVGLGMAPERLPVIAETRAEAPNIALWRLPSSSPLVRPFLV